MINGSLGSVVREDSGLVICVLPMLDYSGTIKNYFVKQLDDTKAGPPWVLTSEKADFCNFIFENISISIENSYFSVDTFLLYYLWSILKTAVLVQLTTSSRRLDGGAYCGARVGGKCMVSKAKMVLYAFAV